MEPKKSTASSSKSKKAWVDDSIPDPTNQTIHPYPDHLSAAAHKWITDREYLKLIIEKFFDAPVVKHLGLALFFFFFCEGGGRGLGWEPLLHISKNYYPKLEVRIALDRKRLSSIIGIPDAGNTMTIDSNKKTIDKDPDWNYEATCDYLEIRPRPSDRHYLSRYKLQKQSPVSVASLIIHTTTLVVTPLAHMCFVVLTDRKPQIIKFTTFNNCSYSRDKANKVWIPPAEEDQQWKCNYVGFRSIK
ncbi:hypothetical protein M9H77_08899 [Catharanthus roseus]|uniref:Uncharacterized protein n=1 Tax=Catharanthus roseus TaxID=4058 RepID=A0ACC0BZA9_CATRO|nr:hypothetical protein M9H77_08899 [Catharanthus roseus]